MNGYLKASCSLWRILGNDLPPRHRRGQTRQNLIFILKHEPQLADCKRHWIVNRIFDPGEEADLLEILEQAGETYLHIPFRVAEYCKLDEAVLAGYPLAHELWSRVERQHHLKCLYLMNVNRARNLAIQEGRQEADWVLPLDGSCCFTEAGWQQLVHKLQIADLTRCIAIPMYRLTANRQYFEMEISRSQSQEPQVAIGREARIQFHPLYRYGRNSKTELLNRLQFSSRRDAAHEVVDPQVLGGYVFRLFSGVPVGEHHWTERAALRERGIDRLLRQADQLAASLTADFDE